MSVNTGTDTWAESLARNPIELIDQARALVEALTDADNKGAASIVERLIERLIIRDWSSDM